MVESRRHIQRRDTTRYDLFVDQSLFRTATAAAPVVDREPEPEPEPEPEQQVAEAGNSEEGIQQMLEFQAQRIVQIETEKRQLVEEVEMLRQAPPGLTEPPRAEEGVPPDQVTIPARVAPDLSDGAALAARSQQQIAELKELLQRSLAQLDKSIPSPSKPAATSEVP